MGKRLQPLSLGINIVRRLKLLLLRELLTAKHITVADDGCQRCFQFMRERSNKILLTPGRLLKLMDFRLKAVSHGIEILCQRADFIVGKHLAAQLIFALGNPAADR